VIDLDELLAPLIAEAPEPKPLEFVRDRAATLRRHRRMRRRVAAITVSVAAVGIGAGGLAVILPGRHRPTVVTVTGPVTTTTIVPRLTVGAPATFAVPAMDMLAAFGSIWVSQPNQVARLDPGNGGVVATIPVPGLADNRALAAGAGSLWVDDTGTETVTRIDPGSNSVVKSLRLPSAPLVVDGLAFTDSKLWVARPEPRNVNQGDIIAIDPVTYRIVAQTPVPRTFTVISGGPETLWFLRAGPVGHGSDVVRFDTRSLRLTILRPDTVAILAATADQLWLQTVDNEVIDVNPNTGAQIGPGIPVADTVNLTAAVVSDVIWIAGQPDSSTPGHAVPYDIRTGRDLAPPVPVGLPIATMATINGALWVDAGGVIRVPYSQS
jgi:hypothetical protein